MINIKELYIGEIGKFEGYIFMGGKTMINYVKIKSVSFYLKKDDYYYDIFTNEKYQILKAGIKIPENGIGLLDPKKYYQYFYNNTSAKLENNFMFTLDELKEIKQKTAVNIALGCEKIEEILKNRKQVELEI